jgi:hypothetical protein
MSEALRYVPPSWSLRRFDGGRGGYGVREIEIEGATDQDTKRWGFRQLPPSRTQTLWPLRCVTAAQQTCQQKWRLEIQSDGNWRLQHLGCESFLISSVRAVCDRKAWVCLATVELTPEVCLSFIYFKVYLTMLQHLRLALKDVIVSE